MLKKKLSIFLSLVWMTLVLAPPKKRLRAMPTISLIEFPTELIDLIFWHTFQDILTLKRSYVSLSRTCKKFNAITKFKKHIQRRELAKEIKRMYGKGYFRRSVINRLFFNQDVNEPTAHKEHPLMIATRKCCPHIVRELIWRGAKVHFVNRRVHETPLIHAAKKGYLRVLEVLINAGSKLNYFDRTNTNALGWAAFYGKTRSVGRLLQTPSTINDKDFNEATPIVWAAKLKFKNVVKLLLQAGAELEHADEEGKTVYDYALEDKSGVLLTMITQHIEKLSLQNNQKDTE